MIRLSQQASFLTRMGFTLSGRAIVETAGYLGYLGYVTLTKEEASNEDEA
jgi:hypothetical protein